VLGCSRDLFGRLCLRAAERVLLGSKFLQHCWWSAAALHGRARRKSPLRRASLLSWALSRELVEAGGGEVGVWWNRGHVPEALAVDVCAGQVTAL